MDYFENVMPGINRVCNTMPFPYLDSQSLNIRVPHKFQSKVIDLYKSIAY